MPRARRCATLVSFDGGPVNETLRRVSAAGVALTLMALVACDIGVGAFRAWWDRHSLTSSVVANLLVLAVTALIVDEVVARRDRRKRAVSVAVQSLIVYGQSVRAYNAVTAEGEAGQTSAAPEELRALASMLLTASSSLFDDPVARRFLEQIERFTGLMFAATSASSKNRARADGHERLVSGMAQVRETIQPLVARIAPEERSFLEGPPTTDDRSDAAQ